MAFNPMNLFWIFIGGGLGSLCRYGLGRATPTPWPGFPLGTLVVNVVACLILGLFVGLELSRPLPQQRRLLVAVGFCGGFSTFSTFALDTLQLLQQQRLTEALLNVGLQLLLCMSVMTAGIWLGARLSG